MKKVSVLNCWVWARRHGCAKILDLSYEPPADITIGQALEEEQAEIL